MSVALRNFIMKEKKMSTSIESMALKLDQFGALAALCTSAKKLSFLKESDELSNCIVKGCVEDLGVSSAWLYEGSADNEPTLRASYPRANGSVSYPSAIWLGEEQIRGLVGRTLCSPVPEEVRNPDKLNESNLYQAKTEELPNAIMSYPLICEGETIGAIAICSPDVKFFSDDRLWFFDVYAQLAAFALNNNRLTASFQEEKAERIRTEQCWRATNDELEERVRRRTAQLEEANEELEAFSYSVSHDLKAPLWAAKFLVEQLADEDSLCRGMESKTALAAIQESITKMSNLIESLLNFSRSTREPLRKSGIEMTELVRTVVNELLPADSGNSLTVSVAPLLPAQGDLSMIRQVWINLILNALKYTRTKLVRQITVTSYEADDDIVYTIADNGVGFDMNYCDKLFSVFQRLHCQDEFEGTGVGLSIVQRIIRRHGGRVWAEAEVDKGAKFHFSLPLVHSIAHLGQS